MLTSIRGSDGYTVIDPGLHTPDAEALWEQVLQERGIGFEHVEQIVLTHHHPDHYGMAGWFQERTGAPVLLSETGLRAGAAPVGPGAADVGAAPDALCPARLPGSRAGRDDEAHGELRLAWFRRSHR